VSKGWIAGAVGKPGALSAQAKRAGMTVKAFESAVLSGKRPATARLSRTLRGLKK